MSTSDTSPAAGPVTLTRRRFLQGAALAPLITSRRAAATLSAARLPRIGVLRWPPPPDRFQPSFRHALEEIGYVEGKTIAIDWRWAEGRPDVAVRHAADLVGRGVDLIVAGPTPAAHAARQATRTIPIVLSGVADPVGSGLVQSLARPGGNITGVSLNLPAVAGKRVEILRQALPTLERAAFLGSALDPATALFIANTEEAAHTFGIRVQRVLVQGSHEFERAFAAMEREQAGAVIVQPIFVSAAEQAAIVALAQRHRLASISDLRRFAEVGGLLSYGPSQQEMYRRVADYVDRVLKGARPAELPVEEPTIFELVINLKTARALGLTMPRALLARADHVIN